ncbi:HEPN domain-containing protein [Candidatus Latescibacterota bacterium]
MSDEEFEALIISQLEVIDPILSKEEIDISARPFAAADIFIKTYLVSVNGKQPDNYKTESWFKYIILPIRKWYETKYGPATTLPKRKASKGVLLYNGVFYELDIPLRVIVHKGETSDFIFPKEILPFEKESLLVKYPPNIPADSPEAKAFKQSVRDVVNLTRSISNNVGTSQFKHKQCRELSQGIEVHMQKAVADILSNKNERFLISYWEIQLAIEKSIKVLIVQANEEMRYTHDLMELWKDLNKIKPGLIQQERIQKFPRAKKVKNYRYGKGPNIRKIDVHRNYLEALKLLDTLTEKFERKFTFSNTVFVLKRFPWQQ